MSDSSTKNTVMSLNSHIQEMLNKQAWPAACLYVVATPIGNLSDLSMRALEVLRRCDAIAAEDTRNTRVLLNAWGLNTQLLPAHRHNEHTAATDIIKRIQAGATIALVSDAGAPAVSDPGAYIVREAQKSNIKIVPIPGPSAVITALMASGATSDQAPGFVFAGFVPSKAKLRDKFLSDYLAQNLPVVMFETPHRISATFKALVQLADSNRMLTIARELTKRFEEIATININALENWLHADPQRLHGEFVLIIHAYEQTQLDDDSLGQEEQAVMKVLLAELSVKDAVRVGVKLTGVARTKLYSWALENSK